jgi:DNA-3-methyladenine glycosylase
VTQTVVELIAAPLSRRAVARLEPLGRRFYQRDTATVARALLGKVIVRRLPEGTVAARLIEVEAYLGVDDPACHSFGGRRTARNEVMWGEAGRLYVYFTYGMHHCANVVTRRAGVPEAVLLRGALPLCGHDLMAARRGPRGGAHLLDGPARLAQALGLDRTSDGADLTAGGAVFLADDGFRWREGWTATSLRVGIGYAGDAAAWPLRFMLAGPSGGRRGVRGPEPLAAARSV